MTTWKITEARRVDLDSDVQRLDVRLTAGRLTVVGTDGPPRVEVSRMAEAPIDIILEGGVLTVAHENVRVWPGPLTPLWWWLKGRHRFTADVSIAVPYETLASLWVASGSVTASGLHAEVSADCVSGRITVLGIGGPLRAKVVSGPIEALGCAGRVDLETISGEITLADTASAEVHAKTVSGSLIADLDNPPDHCDIRLETISGEITIRIREDSDLSIALNAVHGRVTSEFPGIGAESRWGAQASGVIGRPGSGRLVASAVGGNIALLRRPVDLDFGAPDVGVEGASER